MISPTHKHYSFHSPTSSDMGRSRQNSDAMDIQAITEREPASRIAATGEAWRNGSPSMSPSYSKYFSLSPPRFFLSLFASTCPSFVKTVFTGRTVTDYERYFLSVLGIRRVITLMKRTTENTRAFAREPTFYPATTKSRIVSISFTNYSRWPECRRVSSTRRIPTMAGSWT
jgi:hypothetical protein